LRKNQELINAQRAIKNSGLKIYDSEVFNATWVFNNKDDLCQSIFNFYRVPFDKRIAVKIIRLIGAKAENDPIELLDELAIQVLKKA